MKNDEFYKKSIIQHLTKEIEVVTNNIMTYRIRAAFTVWLGPYIILGSLIISTKGSFKLVTDNWCLMDGIMLTAAICYLALGVMAGRIEKQAWEQCDNWRNSIANISMGSISGKEELYLALSNDTLKKKVETAYWFVFVLIIISFACVGYMASHIEKNGADINVTANE